MEETFYNHGATYNRQVTISFDLSTYNPEEISLFSFILKMKPQIKMLVNVMNIAHFHKLCTRPLPTAFVFAI